MSDTATRRRRGRYRNGDSIHLHTGCNSCSPSRVNGILCHEPGCPDAWKDRPRECDDCGRTYYVQDNVAAAWGLSLCGRCRSRL
jgi:hypothetical protein